MLTVNPKDVSKHLKDLRKSQGLRISDLARESSLSEDTIKKIESGHDFKVSSLLRLISILSPKSLGELPPPENVAKTALTPLQMLKIEQTQHKKRVRLS